MISNNLSALLANNPNGGGFASSGVAGLGGTNRNKSMNNEQIEKTAKDFESLFVSQMLEQMFGDSVGSELFGDEETSEIYKGMMMEEYGKQIANSGGIGIADYVKRELLRLQEI